MKIEQLLWEQDSGWNSNFKSKLNTKANLVLAFGGRKALEIKDRFDEIKSFYPNASIMVCSTSGEILDTHVYDNSIVLTAICFEQTELKYFSTEIKSIESSYETGKILASSFAPQGLKHLFLISDGQKVNGSELVRGINDVLPPEVTVTGGLAGDGTLFQKTIVGLNNYPSEGKIAAVAFYGNNIVVNYGSFGGWDSFGPDRLITKSKNNILYELDGQSALDLYKKYLGDQASGLPGTALLFPLSIRINNESNSV